MYVDLGPFGCVLTSCAKEMAQDAAVHPFSHRGARFGTTVEGWETIGNFINTAVAFKDTTRNNEDTTTRLKRDLVAPR